MVHGRLTVPAAATVHVLIAKETEGTKWSADMVEKCCGKDLKRHHKETAKDGLTVWTTYRCAKCKRLQTTVEKKTAQFNVEDLDIDAIYGGIFGGP